MLIICNYLGCGEILGWQRRVQLLIFKEVFFLVDIGLVLFLFIRLSFVQNVLRVVSMLLGVGDIAVNRVEVVFVFRGFTFGGGRITNEG